MTRRLLIKGRVQGVFYRAWSAEQAGGLGLAGWVRNRRDGRVEMLVHGERAAVAEMIERCRRGPETARVDDIEVEEADEAAPSGFETRPTI
ncbi:MAG: acylphosphatase [Allosphingosinicella sp.]